MLEKFFVERFIGYGFIKCDFELLIGLEIDERILNIWRFGYYGGDGDDIDWDIFGFFNNGLYVDDCVWCLGL